MSRSTKSELLEEIGEQFRINQNRADLFDDVAAELLGINRTDLRCVDIVSRLGRTSAGELAREAGLTSGGVTTVVDRLERAGYVRRVADPDDRRRIWIEAMPRVAELTISIWGPLKADWERQAAAMTREQLEFLLRFMLEGNALMGAQIERVRSMRELDG